MVAVTITNTNRAEPQISDPSKDVYGGTQSLWFLPVMLGLLSSLLFLLPSLLQPNPAHHHSRSDSDIATSTQVSLTEPGGAGCSVPELASGSPLRRGGHECVGRRSPVRTPWIRFGIPGPSLTCAALGCSHLIPSLCVPWVEHDKLTSQCVRPE